MLPGLSGIELCRRIRVAARDRAPADHHADRARRGGRARPRPRHRRRRLRRQAVLGARADGARPRAPAPRQARRTSRPCSPPATSSSTARPTASAATASELHLGPTEFRLLEFLMQSPGRVFSPRPAARRRSGATTSISTSARSTSMSAACARPSTCRRQPDPIRTVRGAGYSFDETFARSDQNGAAAS